VATIELYNTLSGTIEPLAPVRPPALRMYCCGPTVYDYGHIGNFRTFLHVDVLRRFVRQQGIAVDHVMNITDVDDKIIRNAAAAGLPIAEYTKKYEQAFYEDLDALSIEHPEHISHATGCIPEMVRMIEQLAAKDIAYRAEDGSWYFRIARFPGYGKLSKKDFEGIEDGARVDVDEYEKDAARDFALWKAAKPGEQFWETPLGTGRPGWHIECSAMARKLLGDDIDLHAGGEDLMFPHHENEIAQSESSSGKTFVRHWMHVRFLLVEGRKMSKSEGNFYTLRDLLLKGHRSSAIRFLLISVPYRNQMNFTFDSLADATAAVEKLRTFAGRISSTSAEGAIQSDAWSNRVSEAGEKFTAALADDLNTARALSPIFEFLRWANQQLDNNGNRLLPEYREDVRKLLEKFDGVFSVLEDQDAAITRAALAWAEREGRLDEADPSLVANLSLTDAEIDALVAERTQAKKSRNFARADAIRNDLLAKGILIEDSKDGVRWKRK
jgi:cysteinyl-tRNA synthetase